jgi:hypothetical protein
MEGGFVDVQICKCADIGRKSKETVSISAAGMEASKWKKAG